MTRHICYRTLLIGFAVLAAGCSKKDSTISQLSGSEPQRISFGDPQTVEANFSQKMAACWFNGKQPLLQGYRYESERVQTGDYSGSRIRIVPENMPASSEVGGGFEVEFHPYNDNTLISTRNLSLPLELASKLKRDIETWIFGRNECADHDASSAPEQAPVSGHGLAQQA